MNMQFEKAPTITEQDASALASFGWRQHHCQHVFGMTHPTRQQAEQGFKITALRVMLSGKPVEFLQDGEHTEAPVNGILTVYTAYPYMHGDSQRYVWGC